MAKVVDWMAPQIPPGARVLDVGGGDGYVVELLLTRRRDISITMTDIAPSIGSFVSAANRSRVTLLPGTDISNVQGRFDVLTLADVIHHVPTAQRPAFFASIGEAARRLGVSTALVKDILPRGPRAMLSLLSDLYVTGDKGVSLMHPDEIIIPGFQRVALDIPDFPNFCARYTTA
jgi:hypothetical protein